MAVPCVRLSAAILVTMRQSVRTAAASSRLLAASALGRRRVRLGSAGASPAVLALPWRYCFDWPASAAGALRRRGKRRIRPWRDCRARRACHFVRIRHAGRRPRRLWLVLTNWHVVSDAKGTIEVVFPDGFRSAAKVISTDRTWDLAALAIWKPNVARSRWPRSRRSRANHSALPATAADRTAWPAAIARSMSRRA